MMASGGTELSTRVSAEDENIENKHINDIALTYFKKYKVEISGAITTTFPFLELIRDRGFITNEMYEKSQESFKKRFSVHEVIYDILSELEKKFDMSVLRALFSKIIVKKYPDLYRIYKIFYKVIPEIKSFLESDGKENEERLNDQLSLEQGTGGNSYQRPIWIGPDATNYNGTALPEHGLSEHCCETQEINVNETGTTTDNNNALENQQGNEKCAQESEQEGAELLHHGNKTSSFSVDLVDIKKKMPFLYSGVECEAQARTGCNQASDVIEINSEDSRESSDGGEPPETSTSALKRKPGTVDFGNNSISEKAKKRRMRSRGRDRIQSLNNRVPRKRSKPKGTKAVNTRPLKRSRKRGPRIPRDKHMNFKHSILTVTCGPAKGELYKEKMKQGISAKCIKTKNGKQLTLKEFEIEGNHERSKNWRLSVRCDGYPLKYLIKKGFLPDPPRTRKIVPDSHSDNIIDPYPENSNICEMCHKGGTLFCCDTCPRSFHDSCHIRHIDPDRLVTLDLLLPFLLVVELFPPCTLSLQSLSGCMCLDAEGAGSLSIRIQNYDPELFNCTGSSRFMGSENSSSGF
ncbi:PREDICTED: nuclear autoantigen Sp-100 isoform X2 [Myotis brandtii]|uniref:nuclear autoantigen Sp-100 isoform X2 n=1 Tax=Myotis brandtii TaxID=109478 RepID=UPI000704519E|nr:PREDICTED: nuclear autoantigen Sp-100 isoform X2 [Myotis brandtii]